MLHVDIHIGSNDWLAAWRPGTNRLLVDVPACPRLHDKVAVRVQFADQFASATVIGTAVSIEQKDPACRIELAPDAEGMRAIRMLNAAARGEPIRFLERAPRYLVKLPVFVEWQGERLVTTTISISEDGCSLRWSGRAPTTGQRLNLRIGSGSLAHDIRGVVCWTEGRGGGGKVGLRIFALNGARQAWRNILGEAVRTGATVA